MFGSLSSAAAVGGSADKYMVQEHNGKKYIGAGVMYMDTNQRIRYTMNRKSQHQIPYLIDGHWVWGPKPRKSMIPYRIPHEELRWIGQEWNEETLQLGTTAMRTTTN